MKNKFFTLFTMCLSLIIDVYAQVPYFAATVGDNKLYGYTSLKFRPGENAQETYTSFQYGLGNSFATGVDLYTGNAGASYAGVLLRYGTKINSYFNVGFQATPTFDLTENMDFSYITTAMYLNGTISKDGKLFWWSNPWWRINKDSKNTIDQYFYLGYSISLNNGHRITPMLGEIHSWKFNQDVDLALGFYYTIKNWNFYFWGNDFLKENPRIVVGLDFIM